MVETLSALEDRIEHHFEDPDLLREALIHTIESPRPGVRSNARLAWLGDAVVKLIVTEALCRNMRDAPKGDLTHERKKYEEGEPQALVARALGIHRHLSNSEGKPIPEEQLQSASAPATAYEAIVGALYLDGEDGPRNAREFVQRTLPVRPAQTP